MSAKRKTQHGWVFVVVAVVALALVGVLLALQPPGDFLYGLLRAVALLGYLAVFASIVSTAYLRELVKFFGRAFIQVHHWLTVTGLVLITVHPLAAVLVYGTPWVILPRFESLRTFLQWAGPPAWDLLVIATIAALLRKRFKNGWRAVHSLTYIAFLLGSIHGLLLGSDTQSIGARVVIIILVACVAYVYARRHLLTPGRAR